VNPSIFVSFLLTVKKFYRSDLHLFKMAEAFDLAAGGSSGLSSVTVSAGLPTVLVDKDHQSYVWSRVEFQTDEDEGGDGEGEGGYTDTADDDNDGDGDGDRLINNNNIQSGVVEGLNDFAAAAVEVSEVRLLDDEQRQRPKNRRSSVPPPRSGAASVILNSKLLLMGGYGGKVEGGRLDDFWMFDLKEKKWEEVHVVSEEKPGCRENNGVVISDSNRSFLLFGGYNGNVWLNDMWRFDIDPQPRWTCLQAATHDVDGGGGSADLDFARRPCARFGYVSAVHENKFVLWGGFDGARWLADCFEFNMLTSTWTKIRQKGSIPSARSCPAWSQRDSLLYIHGGYE
jgi:hypothetical protein